MKRWLGSLLLLSSMVLLTLRAWAGGLIVQTESFDVYDASRWAIGAVRGVPCEYDAYKVVPKNGFSPAGFPFEVTVASGTVPAGLKLYDEVVEDEETGGFVGMFGFCGTTTAPAGEYTMLLNVFVTGVQIQVPYTFTVREQTSFTGTYHAASTSLPIMTFGRGGEQMLTQKATADVTFVIQAGRMPTCTYTTTSGVDFWNIESQFNQNDANVTSDIVQCVVRDPKNGRTGIVTDGYTEMTSNDPSVPYREAEVALVIWDNGNCEAYADYGQKAYRYPYDEYYIYDEGSNIGPGASLGDVSYTSDNPDVPVSPYHTEVIGGVEWRYTVKNGVAQLYADPDVGFTCIPRDVRGEVLIPAMLGGCPVVSVPDAAFAGCSEITSLVIPEGITILYWAAFAECYGLVSVDLPQSLQTIGWEAFRNCRSLQTVRIPVGVTSVKGSAFIGCERAEFLFEGNPIVDVEAGAFPTRPGSYPKNCTLAWKTALAGQFTGVWNNLFMTMRLEYQTQVIGSIEWRYTVENGEAQLYAAPDIGFTCIPRETRGEVLIPAMLGGCPVVSVPDAAFAGCTEITSVTISEGVTMLYWAAFAECYGLTSVKLPQSLQTIGWEAFRNCRNLQVVCIPAGVTSVLDSAFTGCTSLMTVKLSCMPSIDVRDNALGPCKVGRYTKDVAKAWAGITEWHGLTVRPDALAPEEVPVASAPGSDALTKQETERVRLLIARELEDAAAKGVTAVQLTGTDDAVDACLALGIAPSMSVAGETLTAEFRLPKLEVLGFEPAAGVVRVKVVPAGNDEIRELPMTGSVRIIGAASLSDPMSPVLSLKLELGAYLGQDTIGELKASVNLSGYAFIRVEAGKVEDARK